MSSPSETTAYTIRLPDYEGPLDLLLHLIEREELDITRLSLAQVTGQYMQYIAAMDRLDAEHIAEFLVVAARLLLIKSRLLLPQDAPSTAENEDDTGDDLTRQLIEYRRFKQVAQRLREWDVRGLRSFPRIAPRPKVEPRLDLSRVSLTDLAALMEIVRTANLAAPIGEIVAPLIVRVGDRMDDVVTRLKRGESVSFNGWLADARSRLEVIVSFLAILELMKQRKIVVVQDRIFGDIRIDSAPLNSEVQSPPVEEGEPEEPAFVEPQG